MKKIASICLVFFMVLSMFAGVALAAVEYSGDVDSDLAVLLIDADSGRVLFEQQADVQIKPASTTKILTCLVAIEQSNLSDIVTVSSYAAKASGGESKLGIRAGEEFVLRDILTGMMLVSGNDAAKAVAEHVGETEEGFIALMNELAEQIGMTQSHFANPHGKDDEEHYVTARDMTLLAAYAMKNAAFMDIVGLESFRLPATNMQKEREVVNFDFLVRSDSEFFYQYGNGMKTGSTPGAGGCVVSSATKEEQGSTTNLICVVFGDTSNGKTLRWSVVKDLFDFGFDNYVTLDVLTLVDMSEPISAHVENYADNDIFDGLLEFQQPMPTQRYITMDKETADIITSGDDTIEIVETYNDPLPLQAPIYENDVVGSVLYQSKTTGSVILSGNLVASRDVLDSSGGDGDFGDTAVATMPPTVAEEIQIQEQEKKERSNNILLILLVIPAGLVAFLVIRVISAKKHKRKRFTKRRKPRYSYKIRK
ncbi:MAG: D-alanyl-D-alanine carboxypeptidase [Clostridia bacterium]|nr:D-alanyl-D-alanine carboxypeptidase [Clostridia bacterium]